jgi:hypothetical protein
VSGRPEGLRAPAAPTPPRTGARQVLREAAAPARAVRPTACVPGAAALLVAVVVAFVLPLA